MTTILQTYGRTLRLSEAGQSVALVERDRIASGVTGRTTAKITSLHGLRYDYLADRFGLDVARLYAEANEAAIDDIESTVDEYDVDCGFERMPAYTYVDSADEVDDVRAEAQTASHLDLPASVVDASSIPFEGESAVRFDDRAVFHLRAYLFELADRFASGSESYLFERTTVTDVDEGTPCTVSTDRGSIQADDVVVATHFPVVDKGVYFARMKPKRSYILAVRVAKNPPDGMYYRRGDPTFSVRPVPEVDRLVLVGGQGHRTGDGGSTTERYRRLERQARSEFDVEDVKRYDRQLREMIVEGRAEPGFIVSHVEPLEKAPEMYERFDEREEGVTKVLLKP
ncbi:NAD(P)/FAD-dependent oxidoreductase [Halogranum amylolyticum]|uniref:NAD(P)/FAD-dependent oxidoreductase n=1 Tax=Halogranum amylolyticum TaxID=660520 RepID=UPI000B2C4EC8